MVPFLLPCPPFFLSILILVKDPVNQDDRQLLAYAMTSDCAAAWQFSQIEID
jgi:hypothetical protein